MGVEQRSIEPKRHKPRLYPKQQFAQVRPMEPGIRHGWATVEMRDVPDMTTEGDWEIRHVWLTRPEFEALPEFTGW